MLEQTVNQFLARVFDFFIGFFRRLARQKHFHSAVGFGRRGNRQSKQI
jgi:hypothetical protein